MIHVSRRELPAYGLAGLLLLLIVLLLAMHRPIPTYLVVALIGVICGALGLTPPADTGTAESETRELLLGWLRGLSQDHTGLAGDVTGVIARLDLESAVAAKPPASAPGPAGSVPVAPLAAVPSAHAGGSVL